MRNKFDKIEWIKDQHRLTNHLYDHLPYSFHLEKVAGVAYKFRNYILHPSTDVLNLAAWGHDLIEDTRNSYNDVKEVLGEEVADIVYALTNEKGKTRSERANDKYYEEMRKVDGAVFIKLCDRIANVEYSINKNTRMLEAYRKENKPFLERLKIDEEFPNLKPLADYLTKILQSK